MRPAGPKSPGLILAKSFAKPRWYKIPGAYSDKISCYAPLSQYRRGLFWQNLLLRPADLRSPGLIPTKSLATPRWSKIPGAYSGKIFCCAPLIRRPAGIINLVLYPIPSPAKTSGYNQPGFVSYTLAREDQRV